MNEVVNNIGYMFTASPNEELHSLSTTQKKQREILGPANDIKHRKEGGKRNKAGMNRIIYCNLGKSIFCIPVYRWRVT